MDLIQMYHDQNSQSSSSGEETNIVENNVFGIGASHPRIVHGNSVEQQPLKTLPPQRQQQQPHNGTNGRQLHHHVDKLQKFQPTNFAQWLTDIDNRVHLCLGSLNVLHKNTILESMDYFISKLTKDYNKLIKPKIAQHLSNYIRTYLYVYRYLYRSYEMGKRYFKRIVKILTFYTDMELCASIRGTEYDAAIAERIQFIYQTHLLVNDQNMVLDVFLNMKRLWRRHRGILTLLLQHFLAVTEPVELVDVLFIKSLIVFKRWLYIEEVTEDRDRIRAAFVKFVKPKKTICMNSLFKPYLPVDEEGFVRIENLSSVLDTDISIALLTRAMRKAEESTELQANEVLIVLTDDEDEAPTNEFTQLNCDSHHSYSLSNDYDCQSSISTHSTHTSTDIMMIDTLSIDTLPSLRSVVSTQSIDLTTDNTTSVSECVNIVDDSSDSNSASATALCVPSDIMSPNSSKGYANDASTMDSVTIVANDTIAMLCHELSSDQRSVDQLPLLDQSAFNSLVNYINETQINESFAFAASNKSSTNESMPNGAVESDAVAKKPLSCDVTRHEMSCQTTISLPIHGQSENSSETQQTSTEVAALFSNVSDVAKLPPHRLIALERILAETLTKLNSGTANTSISNESLGNHQETLMHIDEVLSADLKTSKTPVGPAPIENRPSTSGVVPKNINASTPKNSAGVQASDELPDQTSIAHNSSTEMDLLSRSEQEILFNDDEDAFAINISAFNDDSMRPGTSKELISFPRMSIDDRPPLWRRNGLNNPPKTYSKIRKEKSASKQLSNVTSPNTIDVSVNGAERPADDEDSFLMDIFCSSEVRSRLTGSTPTGTETVYSSSTPNMSMTPPVGHREPKVNRRPMRLSRKAVQTAEELKSATKVPSPRKTRKKSDGMTTKGNTRRQSNLPKTRKSAKKTTPTRTKTMNKGRLAKNIDLIDETPPTILTRQSYIKPATNQSPRECDNSFDGAEKLHHSHSLLSSSFGRRSNGKFGLTAAKSVSKNAPKNTSTILERKTYIKTSAPNKMLSSTLPNMHSQPYDSCSPNTSGPNITKKVYSNNAARANKSAHAVKNDAAHFGSVVNKDTVESDNLRNIFSDDFDSSKGIRNPIPGLKLTLNTDYLSAKASAQKRRQLSSDYSDMDEMDDSNGYNTRKSKRSRKRPKKLDL